MYPSRPAKHSRIAHFLSPKDALKDVAIVMLESRDNRVCQIYQK